ncbi:MAG: HU family DNA-binding protein [Microthrixaceae bacterium]
MGRNQRQLADQISRELRIPVRKGQRFLQRLLELVADDLVETRRVELRGLGTFAVHHRPEKTTIHPKTHKPIKISASDTVEYRSSAALRRRLKKAPQDD